MAKGKGHKRGRKAKKVTDLANVSSPQHSSEKITKYMSSPTANSGASTTMVVVEKDKSSPAQKDLLSGLVTPESTPTKSPDAHDQDNSPSPNGTLVYPLEPDSPAGAIAGADGGGDASRQGTRASRIVHVKPEGDVQSTEVIDTPTRHKMQLNKGSHRTVKTCKNVDVPRSFNGQLEDKASPKNAPKGQGKGRKKGKSAVDCNNKPSSKSKTKSGPVMKTLTDFFPVRRSDRRCKSVVDAERKMELEEAILSHREEGIKVEDITGKGRGVISTKPFRRGDFVVEYYGDLIDIKAAKDREQKYKADPNIGCYMYYFEHKNRSYCVDATAESGRLGRLLNHSRQGNCCTKLVDIDGRPHLILIAKQDIGVNEELLYDYGDRNKETIDSHPWLVL
nr:N-lysine methyltransferase KMT5A-like isoform X1 [Lytechinus pictus]XP_054749588.1 N-lysine methyltransferase KMT5A-like isoform X2 [Lytechinus pictus]XP_054749589.1 N-lysine methyltransferase KMT5A-like isoform X3 [Lytechinus pictus]XP_054749590.1 N-lysine methyltransferase KMT5A-like isoform X4 [Lytechinus pictus]